MVYFIRYIIPNTETVLGILFQDQRWHILYLLSNWQTNYNRIILSLLLLNSRDNMPNIKRYSKWHFKFPKGIPNDTRLFLFKFALSSFNIWLIELRG